MWATYARCTARLARPNPSRVCAQSRTCAQRWKRLCVFGMIPVLVSVTCVSLLLFGNPLRSRPKTVMDHRIQMLRRMQDLFQTDDFPANFPKEEVGMFSKLCPCEINCQLSKLYPNLASPKAGKRRNEPNKLLLPPGPIFEGRRFANCVAVSNSASLSGSRLGKFIDSHELILRFNHAPTEGFEEDVGSRTDVRIVNDLILRNRKYYLVPSFDFMNDPLYRNLTLIGWVSKEEELEVGEILDNYLERRRMLPQEEFYLFEVQGLWDIWTFFQRFTPTPIVQYTPSSGTLGLVFLLHHCDVVHGVEFIPSIRFHQTYGCHYFEIYQPLPCTFFSPHPKTSEMNLWYRLNKASDSIVFGHGVMQLRGMRADDFSDCDSVSCAAAANDKAVRIDYSLLPNLAHP